jgi:hypothetical protein
VLKHLRKFWLRERLLRGIPLRIYGRGTKDVSSPTTDNRRLEQQLINNTSSLETIRLQQAKEAAMFDLRIREVETKVNKAAAVVAFIATTVGFFGHKILEFLKGA